MHEPNTNMLHRGWKFTFCNLRYTTPTESDLLIATDHKPLLGILNDKEIDSIDNSRLVKLKQKTLAYKSDIIYSCN